MLPGFKLLILLLFLAFSGFSQTNDTIPVKKFWKFSGVGSLTLNQLALSNWAAGGQSSVSFVTNIGLNATYNRGRSRWVNKLKLDYGLVKVEDLPFRKNLDILDLATNYSYRVNNNWRITAFTNVLTQISPGFNYKNDPEGENYISNFLSPAFIQQGVGIEYVLDSISLSVTFSPLAVKHTLVLDENVNPVVYGLEEGEQARHEFGAFLNASLSREIMKNVFLTSHLSLFSNYLDDPENIDVIYQGGLEVAANKFVTVNFNINLIYDDDVLIPEFDDVDGDGIEEAVNERPGLQIKQIFGAGLSYKF